MNCVTKLNLNFQSRIDRSSFGKAAMAYRTIDGHRSHFIQRNLLLLSLHRRSKIQSTRAVGRNFTNFGLVVDDVLLKLSRVS